jgi:hypothetical protein
VSIRLAEATTLSQAGSPQTQRVIRQGLGLGAVMAGGALTGYLAAGTRRGAVVGSLAHLGLFGLGNALGGGGRLTTAERWFFAIAGLGGGAAAGYLFWVRR